MLLACVRVGMNVYYSLGMWVENKVILKDKFKNQTERDTRTVSETITLSENITNKDDSKRSDKSTRQMEFATLELETDIKHVKKKDAKSITY